MTKNCLLWLAFFFAGFKIAQAQQMPPREHMLVDSGWRFALGHAYEPTRDFYNGTSSFSYLAKTGYGDGAASPQFDDRSWSKINLPHDWAVALPFSPQGTNSHGYKAIGRNFPGSSVGWYRKTFNIPKSDLGRHISIAFDGVFRNSIVWVNGHYLGTEPSGYQGFEYDIAEYLNYGGENVIAVRADATMEEGWFYEGAGIYRHVWLNKTDALHIATNGTVVTTRTNKNSADVNGTATVVNSGKTQRNFTVIQHVADASGKAVSMFSEHTVSLTPFTALDVKSVLTVNGPQLWSLETPYLYKLITIIQQNGRLVDRYETTFGIRTIRFDAKEGFFLNGIHIKIHGTNNHQDHAGVGTALPDALQDFRINILKGMGCNAYRCAHHPPTPELLDACDRLGMLVIDENRLMGVSSTELNDLKRMIVRDRNHPSIISWSIGNEEWGIEGNTIGTRIAATMQAYARSVDSTRYITAAISGGIGNGISMSIDVLGYNYVANKNTDEQHKKYPEQLSWGTEEGSTVASRGIYFDDNEKHQVVAYDKKQNNYFLSLEDGWKYYASRSYLAGMFIWTGFDYRGEPTPFGWPSVLSYFGMVDACGFPKDDYYYLKSWWTDQPVLHLLPHWNWKGKEGQEIRVWAHSNCEQIELFLNKKSLGKKVMPANGHLEWLVKYQPGILEAIGYKKGLKITDRVKTTGQVASLILSANRSSIKADERDIAVVNVGTEDSDHLKVPTAENEVTFAVTGPGRIIGVGNGNQTSLEPDQFLEKIVPVKIENLKEKFVDDWNNPEEVEPGYDDSKWERAFKDIRDEDFGRKVKMLVYRGTFSLPEDKDRANITMFYNSLCKEQVIYINGKEVGRHVMSTKKGNDFKLSSALLKTGKNTIAIIGTPVLRENMWASVNQDPGLIQLIYPAADWKRKLFSGSAQVIIQSTGGVGTISLTATSEGAIPATIKIQTKK